MSSLGNRIFVVRIKKTQLLSLNLHIGYIMKSILKYGETSYQSGHMPSLGNRIFAVRLKKQQLTSLNLHIWYIVKSLLFFQADISFFWTLMLFVGFVMQMLIKGVKKVRSAVHNRILNH